MNQKYDGIIDKLEVRFTDKFAAKINVSVLPNNAPFFLIGNDLLGGARAKLTLLNSSDVHCYMVACDDKGTMDIIPFLRNHERNEIPVANKLSPVLPEVPSEVERLFLV